VCFLTVHDYSHILDRTVHSPRGLSCSCPTLALRQPVQDRLDVLLSILYKFDCVVLSEGSMSERTDSLDCPFLSSLMADASVESISNMISNTISLIVGVGGVRVYVSTRSRQRAMDSSKSTSALWLGLMPFFAYLLGCHKDSYICGSQRHVQKRG
jgi:hypothetical protein